MISLDFDKAKRKARMMPIESLYWNITDCKEAIAANPGGDKAGYYADEIHVFVGELNRRNEKKF